MNVQHRAKPGRRSLVVKILIVCVAALFMGMVSRTGGLEEAWTREAPKEAVIVSPCEGFFLVSEYPGEEPLVEPGDMVGEKTIVAYIQSMDHTPVAAGVTGKVVEVMFSDLDPVAVGDPLFRVQLLD